MLSSILKKESLNIIFNKFKYIDEVYVNKDFDYSHDNVQFVILSKHGVDTAELLALLQKQFLGSVKLLTAHDNYDYVLENTKLIWFKGRML